MEARHFLTIFIQIALLIAVAFCMGCSDDKKDSVTNTDTGNHTIVLINDGTNTVECAARQFTRVELTPTDDPSTTITEYFVSTPNTTINITLAIPETGNYMITFYVADIDVSIWWDSIALEVGGSTEAILYANITGFYDNSYVAGIRSSGDNIPCD
jgi:hypothetical protein